MQNKLTNKTILITRNREQSKKLVELIESLGGNCIVSPSVEIKATRSWTECDQALGEINKYHWIIFSSMNGVKFFLQRAREKGIESFNGKVAAIGDKTREIIEDFGWKIDLVPENYSARGLVTSFKSKKLKNKHILIPSSEISPPELFRRLGDLGARVKRLNVYSTVCTKTKPPAELIKAFDQNRIDAILFFSPSAVNCFFRHMGNSINNCIRKNNVPIAAIGGTTSRALFQNGLKVRIVPSRSNRENLLKALGDYFKNNPENVDA